jgi:hypothetical protein
MAKMIKYLFFSIFLLLSGCSSDCKRGGDVDLFYIFDVSKPHLQHIDLATSLSENIYDKFNDMGGIMEVSHKSSIIDEISLKPKSPCGEIFNKNNQPKKLKNKIKPENRPEKLFVDDCLSSIRLHKGSNNTDIFGAMYYASNILQDSSDKFGKVLIIFSDFQVDALQTTIDNKSQDEYKSKTNLDGIDVLLYFSETNPLQGTMIGYAQEMSDFMLKKGAKTVSIKQLSSVGSSDDSLKSKAQEISNQLIDSFQTCK